MMGIEPLPDSASAHLANDETVLWSHLPEAPAKLGSDYLNKPWPWWVMVPLYLIMVAGLYRSYARDSEMVAGFPKLAFYMVIAGGVFWVASKATLALRTAKALEPHAIFQSVILTDRHVIAFNFPSKAVAIPRGDVDAVETDFENGGPALRIKSPVMGKDIVIIGLADFAAAKSIFYAQA